MIEDGASTSTGRRTRRAARKVDTKAFFDDQEDAENIEEASNEQDSDGEDQKKPKRTRKLKKVNLDMATGDEDPAQLFLYDEPIESSSNGIILEFDKYFPFPMTDPALEKDPNLLLIYSGPACTCKRCPLCWSGKRDNVKLIPVVKMSYRDEGAYKTMEKLALFHEYEVKLEAFKKAVLEELSTFSYYRNPIQPAGRRRGNEKLDLEGKRVLEWKWEQFAKSVYWVPQGTVDVEKPKYQVAFEWEFCSFANLHFWLDEMTLHVYLDISPDKLDAIPEQVMKFYFRHALTKILDCSFNDGHFTRNARKPQIPDTFDYPEAVLPEGFALQLRDYQLRSLSWMMKVESADNSDDSHICATFFSSSDGVPIKIKLGHSGLYLDVVNQELVKNDNLLPVPPLRVRGGILADDTGSGKTITCLALIHSAPFTEEHARQRNKAMVKTFPYRIPSRATCVICPSNLHKQWIDEARRCNPKFKVIGLATIKDHQKYSWRDIMMADLVVVSYQFLTNANYMQRSDDYKDLDDKGKVYLESIQFHRIMFDEMHEMGHKTVECQEVAMSLKADYHWGITGTPKFETADDFTSLFPYLNISTANGELFKENYLAREEFCKKFIKRNVPNLNLPPLTNEIVWVTQTPDEAALMKLMARDGDIDFKTRIMMCSHYQIADKITQVVGEEFLPIKEIKKRLGEIKLNVMNKKEAPMKSAKWEYDEAVQNLKDNKDDDNITKLTRAVEHRRVIYESAKREFDKAQGDYNYFINTFQSLQEPGSQNCLICFDTINPECIAMLPCTHLYCYDCLVEAMKGRNRCPLCNAEVRDSRQIIRIKNPEAAEAQQGDATIDTSKYGSKLIALYRYVTELLNSDPNARIILFLQYKPLANFIAETLREMKISFARVYGNVFQRQAAIDRFTKSKDVRLIMLSSEDSVSGINLTQATHVVLLHPFWTDKGEAVDLAFEKQGICRAYRSGLDHPLKVVRFAVAGTVEEELTKKRELKFFQN